MKAGEGAGAFIHLPPEVWLPKTGSLSLDYLTDFMPNGPTVFLFASQESEARKTQNALKRRPMNSEITSHKEFLHCKEYLNKI